MAAIKKELKRTHPEDLRAVRNFARCIRRRRTAPVDFALQAVAVMLCLLWVVPPHPMSIPIVMGAGIAISLIWSGGARIWMFCLQ